MKHETTVLKVTSKSLQQKEVNVPLVLDCSNHFKKGCFGFSSPIDFETSCKLIHEHSDYPLF